MVVPGEVVVCGIRDELKQAFKTTRLGKLFEFYDKESASPAAFGITTAG